MIFACLSEFTLDQSAYLTIKKKKKSLLNLSQQKIDYMAVISLRLMATVRVLL